MTSQPPPGPLKVRSETHAMRLLAQLRRVAGLRQVDLAKRLHVSPSAIERRERSVVGVGAAALIATANALGYDVALIPRQPKEQP